MFGSGSSPTVLCGAPCQLTLAGLEPCAPAAVDGSSAGSEHFNTECVSIVSMAPASAVRAPPKQNFTGGHVGCSRKGKSVGTATSA